MLSEWQSETKEKGKKIKKREIEKKKQTKQTNAGFRGARCNMETKSYDTSDGF